MIKGFDAFTTINFKEVDTCQEFALFRRHDFQFDFVPDHEQMVLIGPLMTRAKPTMSVSLLSIQQLINIGFILVFRRFCNRNNMIYMHFKRLLLKSPSECGDTGVSMCGTGNKENVRNKS